MILLEKVDGWVGVGGSEELVEQPANHWVLGHLDDGGAGVEQGGTGIELVEAGEFQDGGTEAECAGTDAGKKISDHVKTPIEKDLRWGVDRKSVLEERVKRGEDVDCETDQQRQAAENCASY
ncbi:hypothetical protein ccrud_14215 (plasmid) [Corynebacterium crudilactis]|uniref:Uncharacterized protein n=1 Tax=Corynebacterium crudilactis TaxID=1652495 RepID=A0A172QXQ8_9CORY|nr:hypothetical protein ccrud_14215 [Corynebacterium crudilactis]